MTKEEIIQKGAVAYERPRLLNTNTMHYCPGCSHGVVHKLIAEVVEEMGMAEKSVGVSPVGCGVFAYNYLDIDFQEAAHGRASAELPALSACCPIIWSSPTKVTVMPRVSEPMRHCTPSIVEKALPLSSSTTRFTV